MANYPDWVLKYKTKGFYVNKYKDHYRLYKGHCEYKNGKSVRVVDYYCGTITEKDGFIPSKGLISGDILVYEYGFYLFLFNLFQNIYIGQIKLHKKYADSIMVLAICDCFKKNPSFTALHLLFPKYNSNMNFSDEIELEIKRVSTMMKTIYTTKCATYNDIENTLATLKLVYVNKRYYLSSYDHALDEIFNTFGFEVKNYGENQ